MGVERIKGKRERLQLYFNLKIKIKKREGILSIWLNIFLSSFIL